MAPPSPPPASGAAKPRRRPVVRHLADPVPDRATAARPRYEIRDETTGADGPNLRVRLIDASNGNIDSLADISPIRALIAQGCDLERSLTPWLGPMRLGRVPSVPGVASASMPTLWSWGSREDHSFRVGRSIDVGSSDRNFGLKHGKSQQRATLVRHDRQRRPTASEESFI